MSFPSFISKSQAANSKSPPLRFIASAGAVATVATPPKGEFNKIQDLMLWSDKPWRFVAGRSQVPATDGDFGFGSPSPPEDKSVLKTATPLVDVGSFRIAATPYPGLMAKVYAAAPVWWTARGGIEAAGADLVFRALPGPLAASAPIQVGAQGGIHFVVADRVPLRLRVGAVVAFAVDFTEVHVPVPWTVAGWLDMSLGGLRIRQVAAMPVPGDGVVGELRAVDDGVDQYLCIKVDAVTWKKTNNFQP